MQYISTRDSGLRVSAAEAIFRGIAPDGGLFIPESLPTLDGLLLKSLCKLDYTQRVAKILSLFLPDFTEEEITSCVGAAYGTGFEEDCPAPLSSLVGGSYFLELWHGPTCAFKDMALQLLPELLTTAMKKVGNGREAVILVATSGDTGKAALEGFRDVPGTRIVVYYPQEGVSPMQQRQMVTQQGGNVSVVAVKGNFDDAQTGVKAIFGDQELAAKLAEKKLLLSSANSINWGRLLPQIVYYISAYCELVLDHEIAMGTPVNFCVPTGNFGNILAGHYARRMGLPIKTLVCASNKNSVLTDLLKTGVYDRNRPFYTTLSPSMDILISSNLERLLFELCGNSDTAVAGLMDDLRRNGKFCLPQAAKEMLAGGFWGGCCDDNATKESIRTIFEKYSYLCDPHTAVAANVAEQYLAATGDTTPMVVVSTASPYKFAGGVLEALGQEDLPQDDFAKAALLEAVSGVPIPAPITALATAPRRFTAVCKVNDMAAALAGFLNLAE